MFENKNNTAELRDFLYAKTVRGKWEEVVEKFAEFPEAQRLKLTRKGDTALHLAVIDNQEQIVERLVKLIVNNSKSTSDHQYNYKQLLEITNERKNNPLHLAAAMGNVTMCHVIASAHEKLLDMRNKVDETPLFLAAVYGHKDAFYCLYYFCSSDLTRASTNCREKFNGDTVLHRALRNDHFDLAFHLIHMNKEAMSWVNEQGFTPLHVLATKPTSFKSGSYVSGIWHNIIYYCTFVDKLKPQPIESLREAWKKRMPKAKKIPCSFPANYETCIEFFMRFLDAIFKVTTLKRIFKKMKNTTDSNIKDDHVNDIVVDESHEYMDTQLLKADHDQSESEAASSTHFPKNYTTCMDFFQIVFTGIMIILGFGSTQIRKIREKKQKHTWSVQVMEKLLEFAPSDKYNDDGKSPMEFSKFQADEEDGITHPYSLVDDQVHFSNDIHTKPIEHPKDVTATETDTVMLLATKHGVIEIVRGMLERFPLAIHECRKDKKNVVLLAAEYRQPDVYRFLLKKKHHIQNLFRAVDLDGNSALHLAASASKSMLWRINGATLQMQWEVKWYKFIEESMPIHFFAHYNKQGRTATTIFHDTHMDMVKDSEDWLTKTSKSCSVVAALIVTVAFTSVANIPGGFEKFFGSPVLEKDQSFLIFAVSSLIALSLSSTSVTTFLSILTYRFDTNDFRSDLPWKLFFGFSSLFFSIISMLVSFCAGHYFLIDYRLQNVALLFYTLIFLPVALIFVISKLPLYFDVLNSILRIMPRRSASVVLSDPAPLPATAAAPTNPSKGKFEVSLIRTNININMKSDGVSLPLLIFTPTTQGSYPVILLFPGCVESFHSAFLQLIASHGCVIVAPQLNWMATSTSTSTSTTTTTRSTTEMKKTESKSDEVDHQTWVTSEQEMVEAKVSKLSKVYGESESTESKRGDRQTTIFSLTLGYDSRPSSHPFAALIGFHPLPGTTFSFPHSQFHSFNISTPIQFVISNLSANVKF